VAIATGGASVAASTVAAPVAVVAAGAVTATALIGFCTGIGRTAAAGLTLVVVDISDSVTAAGTGCWRDGGTGGAPRLDTAVAMIWVGAGGVRAGAAGSTGCPGFVTATRVGVRDGFISALRTVGLLHVPNLISLWEVLALCPLICLLAFGFGAALTPGPVEVSFGNFGSKVGAGAGGGAGGGTGAGAGAGAGGAGAGGTLELVGPSPAVPVVGGGGTAEVPYTNRIGQPEGSQSIGSGSSCSCMASSDISSSTICKCTVCGGERTWVSSTIISGGLHC